MATATSHLWGPAAMSTPSATTRRRGRPKPADAIDAGEILDAAVGIAIDEASPRA